MALAGLFNLFLIISYLLAYPGAGFFDPTVLVHAGDKICARGLYCEGLYVFEQSGGYDGIFYFLIAKNPLDIDMISNIPRASYRYQRIAYPLLAHILSMGYTPLLPYVLPIMNLTFVMLCVRSFSMMLGGTGRSCIYPALAAGVCASMLLDVAEPMWMYLTLEAFRNHMLRRHQASSIMFLASALTKETTLLLLAPLIIYMLMRQRRDTRPYLLAGMGFVFWHIVLYAAFGDIPLLVSADSGNMFQGLHESVFRTLDEPSIHRIPVHLLQLSALACLIISLFSMRCKITRYNLILFACALLSFRMRDHLIADIFSASRNFLPLACAMMIYYADTRDPRAHIALILQAAFSPLMIAYYLAMAANLLG